MGVDLSIVRVGMQMEERRRVPLPRHWIGKMSCGGRSSAMEQVKEAGTPNLVGQAMSQRLAGTRQIDAASSHLYGFEGTPLPPTTVGVSTQNERNHESSEASSHCGKKLPQAPIDTGRSPSCK